MNIHILDTSVFLNLLDVPGRNQERDQIIKEFRTLDPDGNAFLLPIAAIIETGNHIAQCGDGGTRRKVALRFTEQVSKALEGSLPFKVTPIPDSKTLHAFIGGFPDQSMRGTGFGDYTIIQCFEEWVHCHPRDWIRIWAIDGHLDGFVHEPDYR